MIKGGQFAEFTNVGSVITADGTYNTITIIEEDVEITNFSLSNTLRFQVGVLAGGPVSWRNPSITLTFNHA